VLNAAGDEPGMSADQFRKIRARQIPHVAGTGVLAKTSRQGFRIGAISAKNQTN